MDTGGGKFKMLDEKEFKKVKEAFGGKLENTLYVFSIGEELEIKGSRFRVKAIGTDFIRLQLLPRKEKE